jgi:hypothetical protein
MAERYTPPGGGKPVHVPTADDPFDSPNDRSGPGPWFYASFESDCDGCGEPLYEGDLIRADGDGGYEGQDCCGDD